MTPLSYNKEAEIIQAFNTCSQNRQSIKFQIMKILILLKRFISLFYIIRCILRSIFLNIYTRGSF